MNDLHSRNRLARAIDLLQLESDAQQSELLQLTAQARPDLVGSILRIGRTIDILERSARELRDLLDDHPPRLGGAASRRLVPGSERDLDRPAGMGLVAA
jgi:hypothetical protein